MGIVSERRRKERARRMRMRLMIAAVIVLLSSLAMTPGLRETITELGKRGLPVFEQRAEAEMTLPKREVYALQLGVFDSGERAAEEAARLQHTGVPCIVWQREKMRIVCPRARIIFATSTPVSEAGWQDPKKWFRSNADIRAYNELACEIVTKYGMAVNDLYAALENAPESWHSDQTHYYTKDATVCLTRKVSGAICDALGIAVPEKTDEEILDGMRPAHKTKIFGI